MAAAARLTFGSLGVGATFRFRTEAPGEHGWRWRKVTLRSAARIPPRGRAALSPSPLPTVPVRADVEVRAVRRLAYNAAGAAVPVSVPGEDE